MVILKKTRIENHLILRIFCIIIKAKLSEARVSHQNTVKISYAKLDNTALSKIGRKAWR